MGGISINIAISTLLSFVVQIHAKAELVNRMRSGKRLQHAGLDKTILGKSQPSPSCYKGMRRSMTKIPKWGQWATPQGAHALPSAREARSARLCTPIHGMPGAPLAARMAPVPHAALQTPPNSSNEVTNDFDLVIFNDLRERVLFKSFGEEFSAPRWFVEMV